MWVIKVGIRFHCPNLPLSLINTIFINDDHFPGPPQLRYKRKVASHFS